MMSCKKRSISPSLEAQGETFGGDCSKKTKSIRGKCVNGARELLVVDEKKELNTSSSKPIPKDRLDDMDIGDFDIDMIGQLVDESSEAEQLHEKQQPKSSPLKEVSFVEITRPAEVSDADYDDPKGPYQVQKEVARIVRKWDVFSPVSPDYFLAKLLDSRGYSSSTIPAITSSLRKLPTPQQLNDYDVAIIRSIRSSNLDDLRIMVKSGKCMSACNRFSESIVHLASRSAEFHILEFIIRNGGDPSIVDDYGRTPLHDACWRAEPRFDVVTLLLATNVDLIRVVDVRGSSPLNYVRREHWLQWCAFIYHMKDKFWPVKAASQSP